MKIAKNVLFAGLIALAVSFTGCKTDAGDPQPPDLGLPSLTEAATGRATVTVSDATLTGDGAASITIPQQTLSDSAGTFSVTGGKLSFTLNTPSPLQSVTVVNTDSNSLPGIAAGKTVTISDPSAQIYRLPDFSYDTGSGKSYSIYRIAQKTDEATYSVSSLIAYIYIDRDCTITRSAVDWTETSNGYTFVSSVAAIDLPFKTGWNLIQMDCFMTLSGTTYTETWTVKLADKDVPWVIEED
jgi:hypothetical protein